MRGSEEDHLAVFVFAVIKQRRFMCHGDTTCGNSAAKKYAAAARALLGGGEEAINRFATLLAHESDDVRAMAGAFLLKARTDAAVATLRPLARGSGIAALGAKLTLERYTRGDLDIR